MSEGGQGPAISAARLTKRYGALLALDELSLQVARGEVLALLGPNGAGKTTAIEILEGYRRADSGAARVLGLDPIKDAARLRPWIGVMLQEGGLYSGIKVREVVGLFASFYEEPLDSLELIESVGLAGRAGQMFRRLSGGERQRLNLALALVGRARVLFLDEPTAGMDPRGRAQTWQMLRDLRDQGTTLLVTTHLLEEAERLADRVAIIDRGRLVALGRPEEIAGGHRSLRFRTDRPFDPELLARVLGRAPVALGNGLHRVKGPPTPSLIATLAAWMAERDILLLTLDTGAGSLEEVFMRLTRET